MIYVASLKKEVSDRIKGYDFIATLDQLYEVISHTEEINEIKIMRDFRDAFLPGETLNEFVQNTDAFNHNVNIILDDVELTERSRHEKSIALCETPQELLTYLTCNPEACYTVKGLLADKETYLDKLMEQSSSVNTYLSSINLLKEENEHLKQNLKEEQWNSAQFKSSLDKLMNNIANQYSIKLKQSSLFRTGKTNFKNTLYIKEVTRVPHVDTLIYMLMELLRLEKQLPVRLVVIEGDFALGKVAQYPTLTPSYSMSVNSILHDNILMLGFQRTLFESILENPANQDSIIILDRSGYREPYLVNKNVEYLFTVSDPADIENSDIPKERVISRQEYGLQIPEIDDYEYLSNSERLSVYSSMPIIKTLIRLMEK